MDDDVDWSLQQLWRRLPRREPASLSSLCETAALQHLAQLVDRLLSEHRQHPALLCHVPPPLRQLLADRACASCQLPEATLTRLLATLCGPGLRGVWLREPMLTPCMRAVLYSSLARAADSLQRLRVPLSAAGPPVHGERDTLAALLTDMPQLVELSLPQLAASSCTLRAVARGCPQLRRLDLEQAVGVDDVVLDALLLVPTDSRQLQLTASPCAGSLRELQLTGTAVTRDGVARALRLCGRLQVLHHPRVVCGVAELLRRDPSPQLQLLQLWAPDAPHASCRLSDAARVCPLLVRLSCGPLHDLTQLAGAADGLRELALHRLDMDGVQLCAALAAVSFASHLRHLEVSFSRAASVDVAPLLVQCCHLRRLEVSGCGALRCSPLDPPDRPLHYLRLQSSTLSVDRLLLPLLAGCRRLRQLLLQWLEPLDAGLRLGQLVPDSCERLLLAGGQPSVLQVAELVAERPGLEELTLVLEPGTAGDFTELQRAATTQNLALRMRVTSRHASVVRQVSSVSMDS